MTRGSRRPAVGISTGCLRHGDKALLLETGAEFLELYNLDVAESTDLARRCRARGVGIACHVPTPHGERPQRRFVSSGDDADAVREAIGLTRRTLDFAALWDARYVVVHFPSPYEGSQEVTDGDIDRFFEPTLAHAEKVGVPLAVENLSAHAYFHSAAHYARLFGRFPSLGLCLDLVHAHLLRPATEPGEFISHFAERILAVHAANATVARLGQFGSEPPASHQRRENGWMDFDALMSRLGHLDSPPDVTLETASVEPDNIPELTKAVQRCRILSVLPSA